MIASFWDDGISNAAYPSQLLYATQGTAPSRRFVTEFRDWDLLTSNLSTCFLLAIRASHQIILHEAGDIELRYGPRVPPGAVRNCTGGTTGTTGTQHSGACATIGMEGFSDVDGVQCNTATPAVADGRVIYFVHPR